MGKALYENDAGEYFTDISDKTSKQRVKAMQSKDWDIKVRAINKALEPFNTGLIVWTIVKRHKFGLLIHYAVLSTLLFAWLLIKK